ncbi:MAG: M24 family metallopeptidase [Legionellales bacterium]|nr:M24 family metallopeptidase [Legionellales bacterium]
MITQQEYQQRRIQLVNQLESNSVVIIPAAQQVVRNNDVHYRFRQDSDFFYLTGLEEPDAILVLLIDQAHRFQYILFTHTNNPEQMVWHGARIGQDGAEQQFLADDAYPLSQWQEKLPKWLADRHWIYTPLGKRRDLEQQITQVLQQFKAKTAHTSKQLIDVAPLIHAMRVIKSDTEIKLMRHVAKLSAHAHVLAMQQVQHLQYEYEVEAQLLYEFHRQGCRAPAYDSIVAGGANACILHYTHNQDRLRQGDLLLIDAGGEYQNYAADITRTFPIQGQFNAKQQAIYELVLAAQLAGLEQVKPKMPWDSIQQRIVEVITQGLMDLGLLTGSLEQLIAEQAYRSVYMHNSGHWLGLDVHDVGDYKINGQSRTLQAGMVLTVEPGIYIAENNAIDEAWHGIGVRIEDDVLVTEQGCEILSVDAPKTIADIQTTMRNV